MAMLVAQGPVAVLPTPAVCSPLDRGCVKTQISAAAAQYISAEKVMAGTPMRLGRRQLI
jgi:hypothetical protein